LASAELRNRRPAPFPTDRILSNGPFDKPAGLPLCLLEEMTFDG
jgi:hypothetical protein